MWLLTPRQVIFLYLGASKLTTSLTHLSITYFLNLNGKKGDGRRQSVGDDRHFRKGNQHGGARGFRRNQASALAAGEGWGGGCDPGAGGVEPGTPGRREGRRRRDSERKLGVGGWGSGLGREPSKLDAVFGQRAEWLRREEDNTDAVAAGGRGFRTHSRRSAQRGKGRRGRN